MELETPPISPLGARNRLGNCAIRVAVIGCGAVARQFHLPVLAGHEQVTIAALVDRNRSATMELADSYRIEKVFDDVDCLDSGQIDAAVVATPAFHHAPCAIALARRGIHVLVEKPMATCYQGAMEMVEAADDADVVLSVGLFRRLMPGLRMLRAAVDAEYLGRPLQFDLEGGAVYGWQAATLGNMRKEMAGGGVLMDMGPHYFDQLLAVFDGPGEVIDYRDNSLGGIEADCVTHVRLQHRGQPIDGRVSLSRTRILRNSIVIHCERGSLELGGSERFRVQVRPTGMQLSDPHQGHERPFELSLGWSGEAESDWYETFRAEIDDWLDAIRRHVTPKLSGRSALASMRLIDECYQHVQPLAEPWVEHPLCTIPALQDSPSICSSTKNALTPRKVLITGATGFIGCRVAEILSRRAGYQVRALVRSPANASRLARLPVEMVQGDLTSSEDAARVIEGCDAVVHCAVGTEYGNQPRIREVTVGGTMKLVDAALAADIDRFVHISSIAVYGNSATGILDEATPVGVTKGDGYGETKLGAERAVADAHRRGLDTIIFRPGCVYGPFGATFTSRPLQYLAREGLVLQGSADTACNTVYVDNLVEAIILALEAPKEVAGEVFALADDDGLTWGGFYGFFADALGKVVRKESRAETNGKSHSRLGIIRAAMSLATSSEFKELGKKILNTDPIGGLPRRMLQGSPRLEQWIRRRLGSNKPVIYVRKSTGEADVLRITPRHAQVRSDKARRLLRYGPLIPREEALQRSLDWARHARIV